MEQRREFHEHYAKRRKELQVPRIRDVDEMLRLMARVPTVQTIDEDFECAVCRAQDHCREECPCFDKIPAGVVLTPGYDYVCNGCGKIGEDCCSQGTYARRKECAACTSNKHWYWERKCYKLISPRIPRLPFTHYEEVPCPDQDGPPWLRIVHSDPTKQPIKNEEEPKPTEQPGKEAKKKFIARAELLRNINRLTIKSSPRSTWSTSQS